MSTGLSQRQLGNEKDWGKSLPVSGPQWQAAITNTLVSRVIGRGRGPDTCRWLVQESAAENRLAGRASTLTPHAAAGVLSARLSVVGIRHESPRGKFRCARQYISSRAIERGA
jgi:hypothetical protein